MFTRSQIKSKLALLRLENGQKIEKVCFVPDVSPFFLSVSSLSSNPQFVQRHLKSIVDLEKVEELIYYGFPDIRQELLKYQERFLSVRDEIDASLARDHKKVEADMSWVYETIMKKVKGELDLIHLQIDRALDERNTRNMLFVNDCLAEISSFLSFLDANHQEEERKNLVISIERSLDPSLTAGNKIESLQLLQTALQGAIRKNCVLEKQIRDDQKFCQIKSFFDSDVPFDRVYSKYIEFDAFPESLLRNQVLKHLEELRANLKNSFKACEKKIFAEEASKEFEISEKASKEIADISKEPRTPLMNGKNIKKLVFLSELELSDLENRSSDVIDSLSINLSE